MADGSDHCATFAAVQEWLSRHPGAPYLLPLTTAPPAEPALATLQQRHQTVLRLLMRGYSAGILAGASDVAAPRQAILGSAGVEGACTALAQRGFLATFAGGQTPASPPFPHHDRR